MEEKYVVKGVTSKISATSRAAVKIRDNYYTIEFTEERTLPDIEGINVEAERILLFDAVNNCVDRQIEDILNTFQNNKK